MIYVPSNNAKIKTSTLRHINGKGNGSVLLNLGGAGAGSSYESVSDYMNTTGLDPYISGGSLGLGTKKTSINSKLENLMIKPKKSKKEKNITFNI